jgi:hypothetical protein
MASTPLEELIADLESTDSPTAMEAISDLAALLKISNNPNCESLVQTYRKLLPPELFGVTIDEDSQRQITEIVATKIRALSPGERTSFIALLGRIHSAIMIPYLLEAIRILADNGTDWEHLQAVFAMQEFLTSDWDGKITAKYIDMFRNSGAIEYLVSAMKSTADSKSPSPGAAKVCCTRLIEMGHLREP